MQISAEEDAKWKTLTLFLILLVVLGLCALILYPFVPAITGAIVLAVVTHRPLVWCRAKIRNRTLAAVAALFVVISSIIVPVQFLIQYLVRKTIIGAEMLRDGRVQLALDRLLDRFPAIGRMLERSADVMTLPQAAQKLSGFAAANAAHLFTLPVTAITQIVIMLFLLFFLYRDEEAALSFLAYLLPFTKSETDALVTRLAETIRATVLGRLVIGLTQGVVAGVAYGLLGVHAAVILGLLSGMFGLVPPFGAYVVWLPVAIYFGATGHWVKMAILAAVGSLVISTLDNFLYPALVGSQLRQHTVSIFLSLLGGVWLFGVPGLVLGPLTFTATATLLDIWRARTNTPT
jgi:predicted PurR-regulated permease PerM